jgi:hypothetical protein
LGLDIVVELGQAQRAIELKLIGSPTGVIRGLGGIDGLGDAGLRMVPVQRWSDYMDAAVEEDRWRTGSGRLADFGLRNRIALLPH